MKNTHNTVDCKRYEKDGTQKKNFKSKKGNPTVKKTTDCWSYKTMKCDLKKMRTDLKEMKKGSRKSKKREREDSSDNSNSS